MRWMIQNNVQGFTEEAVRTLERKVQGDLSLANETVQAHLNPTEGQKLLQAGSSAVAKVAQSPAANGFWGMGAAAGPVATNDVMPALLRYLESREEKDRQHQKEREEKDRQARALELAEREKDREVCARMCVCACVLSSLSRMHTFVHTAPERAAGHPEQVHARDAGQAGQDARQARQLADGRAARSPRSSTAPGSRSCRSCPARPQAPG